MTTPPRLATRLLRAMTHERDVDDLLVNLETECRDCVDTKGPRTARRW